MKVFNLIKSFKYIFYVKFLNSGKPSFDRVKFEGVWKLGLKSKAALFFWAGPLGSFPLSLPGRARWQQPRAPSVGPPVSFLTASAHAAPLRAVFEPRAAPCP
jgi:hypothetical protein